MPAVPKTTPPSFWSASRATEAAFAQLYDLLSSRVFGLVLRVIVNRSHMRGAQEIFLEIWQSAAQFAPNKGQGRAWVMTIAHRRAVDRVRSAQSSADRDERAGLRNCVPSRRVSMSRWSRIESRRVSRALETLPEPQREALTSPTSAVTVRARSRR
jgi:RNA polymerase sigma-70 factor (ECF subfamily)